MTTAEALTVAPPQNTLRDWADPRFVDSIMAKQPAPRNPETGEQLWESGIRLQPGLQTVMKSPRRFIQGTGGWRGGKSFGAAGRVHVDVVWRKEITRVLDDKWWVVGPTYDLCQEDMRHLANLFDGAKMPFGMTMPDDRPWTMTFPDTEQTVETRSGKDAAKLASVAVRGVVLSEAHQLPWAAFLNSRGRVTQTRGWVLCEGTFEPDGAQWFRQIAMEWKKPDAMGITVALPTWENTVVFPLGRKDPEIALAEATFPPDIFLEKFGGEIVRRTDMAIDQADERWHIRHRYPSLGTSFEPEQPVTLWIDPGVAHAYAVLAVQFWHNVAWVIDTVYRHNRETKQLVDECARRPWARNVERAVLDFAANQRRAEGPPVIEQWAKGWLKEMGRALPCQAVPVALHSGYSIHKRALLNSWPEDEAQRRFNSDRKLMFVTDPSGPRLMFSPEAAIPFFGGVVDGTYYEGEYNLHKKKKNSQGVVTSDDYEDTHNDGIKAVNYGMHDRFGVSGDKPAIWENNQTHIPWEIKVAV